MSKLQLRSLMIFSEKPEKLREFYEKIFGKKPDMDEDDYFGFTVGDGFIGFGSHDKVKGMNQNPERVMWTIETKMVKQEYERMLGLGAKSVAEPYEMGGMWIATLADPDGNYFQLMTPWQGKE